MNVMPEDHETAYFCQVQTLPQTDDKLRRLLHNAYDKHPICKDILDKLRDGQYHPRFNLHCDFLVTREIPFRLLIPDDKELRASLFKEIHDTPLTGYPDFHKFIAYVRRHFVGPHLRRDVLDFTRTCPHCQIAKPRNNLPYGLIMPLQPPPTSRRALARHLNGSDCLFTQLTNLQCDFCSRRSFFQDGSFHSNSDTD